MRITSIILSLLFATSAFADISLYTDRPTARMQVVADSFKAATGINVAIVEKPTQELKALLVAEGSGSPADVIFVKDLVYTTDFAKAGLFQAMPADVSGLVDASMRAANNHWAAITYRVRTLVYDKSIADVVANIKTYEDLAKPEFAGTLCLRTSKSSYNEALLASLINSYGYNKAGDIVKGWVANRVEDIYYADDTAIINAIATQGTSKACYFGITNSYYLGLYMAKNQLNYSTSPVGIKFLKQKTSGVHSNGMAAGIAAKSDSKDEAAKFIKHMLGNETQIFLTDEQQDFPARKGLAPTNLTLGFDSFSPDSANWSVIGENVGKAKQLMIETDYVD